MGTRLEASLLLRNVPPMFTLDPSVLLLMNLKILLTHYVLFTPTHALSHTTLY